MNPITLFLKVLIRGYQLVISPWLMPSCRYEPSCSHYALQAVDKHGPLAGVGLAVWRLLRCQPWGGHGYDPVPEGPLFRRRQQPGGQRIKRT